MIEFTVIDEPINFTLNADATEAPDNDGIFDDTFDYTFE